MKQAAGIVTDYGGRTCHAAIVSRELGIPAVVGTGDATEILSSGGEITLSCWATTFYSIRDLLQPAISTMPLIGNCDKFCKNSLQNL